MPTTWARLCAESGHGPSMFRAVWNITKVSRAPLASRRSSLEFAMQMADAPYSFPDASGHFGPYGGAFVSETLIPAIDELKAAYAEAQQDPAFIAEFEYELKHY